MGTRMHLFPYLGGYIFARRVKLNSMHLQEVETPHDTLEAGLAAFVHAIKVVKVGGSVNGDSDQEMIGGQKLTPLVIEQHSVSLKIVFNLFPIGVFLLMLDHLSKVLNAQNRWFTSLPGKGNDRPVISSGARNFVRRLFPMRHSSPSLHSASQ